MKWGFVYFVCEFLYLLIEEKVKKDGLFSRPSALSLPSTRDGCFRSFWSYISYTEYFVCDLFTTLCAVLSILSTGLPKVLIYLLVTPLSNISTALSTSLSTDHSVQLLICLPLYLLLYQLIYLLISLLSTLFIHLFTHQSFNLSRYLVISSPDTLFTEHFIYTGIYTSIYILASKHSLKHLSVWQKSTCNKRKSIIAKWTDYTHQLIFMKPTQ